MSSTTTTINNNATTTLKLVHNGEIRRTTLASARFGDVQARAVELFGLAAAPLFSYVDADGDVITVGSDQDCAEALGLTNKLTVVSVATPAVPTPSSSSTASSSSTPAPSASASTASNPLVSLGQQIAASLKADRDVQELARNFGLSLDAELPDIIAQVRASPLLAQFFGADAADDDDDDAVDDNVVKNAAPAAPAKQAQPEAPAAPVTHNAFCDGDACRTPDGRPSRIVGLRFKCASCPDFDFCERCYTFKGESHPSSHMFFKIASAHPVPRACGGGRPFWAHQHPHCPRFIAKPAAPASPAAAPAAPAAHPHCHRFAAKAAAAAAAAAAEKYQQQQQQPVAEPQQQPAKALYELEHVADHGTMSLAPGQQYVKLVKVKNLSDAAFEAASLLFADGDRIGAVRVPIGKIGAGEERLVAIDIQVPQDAAGKRLVSVYRLTRNVKAVVDGPPVVLTVNVGVDF